MSSTTQEEAPPAPNWLLKLEEQRARRLRTKLGHEAGAGAPCQICGAKCPGLDLHFWRKICKICKCGKEDHDISDEDIYGFVQFTLLGSKPVKTKGILLKGSNNEVILEFTPKGSSNDVKKYLDELPADLVPVKGSEAAKLRKQRLQKQMPAHDIDPTLCHALTDDETKQLEEYVAFIRKHSVGQGSIIRLPLYKGNVLLANNLQNLSICPEKSLPNFAPNTLQQINDNQNPVGAAPLKINDVKYEIHPLTTSNVERHQEQYENFDINNANLYNAAGGFIPGFGNPLDEQQNPVNPKIKDLYAVTYAAEGYAKAPENYATAVNPTHPGKYPKAPENYPNPGNCAIPPENPPNPGNYPYLRNYPNPLETSAVPEISAALETPAQAPGTPEIPPPINEKTHPKFNDQNLNFPANNRTHNLKPLNLVTPINDRKVPTFGGFIKDLNYPTSSAAAPKKMPILQAQNLINPMESHQNLTSVGFLQDLNYAGLKMDDAGLKINDAGLIMDDANSNFPPNKSQEGKCHEGKFQEAKCHECKVSFPDGGVAVSAERTTNLWHAKCFNCHTCKQPLADLLYFYHKDTDNIYCGRDYAILKGIPRCAACDELIFVREYCLAEGSTFHVKHFCCFECDQPLAGKSYLMESNQPVCLECFENLKAESCRDCGNVIRPEEQGVCLQELHWHATDCCFVCKKCRKPLLGQKMLLRNENLFCSDFCYKNY